MKAWTHNNAYQHLSDHVNDRISGLIELDTHQVVTQDDDDDERREGGSVRERPTLSCGVWLQPTYVRCVRKASRAGSQTAQVRPERC
jgi:hypothetical protein